ncbi:MAG: site-specific integrase [Bacteroidales bacterium]|jgi:integrase|nr:site-specific integrase [Bacteroidales bacterium]
MATKVTLRQKTISGNRKSLYLDFYPAILHPETGKPTRREFLGLYIFDKPKNPFDKESNKETLLLAKNIRAKRQIEIQAENYGFLSSKLKAETDFVQFFKQLVDTKTGSNKKVWQAAFNYFNMFTGGKLPVAKLNESLCNEFRKYLLTAKRQRSIKNISITQNSARTYHNIFKAALKQAFKKGLIDIDLSTRIDGISGQETQREYLTLEQLQALANTPCSIPLLKNAAIFSALTGLRFSDISKLVWSEVHYSESEGYYLQFRQKKTKGVEVLPISEQALNLLGTPGEPTKKVFEGLKYSAYLNLHLKQWVLKAGITKDITFHSFRHTFATLQLSMGTDIYTVSKMLGHRELQTTQVYAKIIDESKRKAANRIKLDM